jgi:signal transduction histidine kinase
MNIINNIILNAIVVVLISGSSFYLGLLAFRQDRTAPESRIFARFSFATALWILLAYIPDVPIFRGIAEISAKLNYLALLTVSFTLFEFPHFFPYLRKITPFIRFPVLGVAVVVGFFTLFTDKVIAGFEFFDWGVSYVDGELAGPFYLYMMFGPVIAFVQYLFLWRKFSHQDKKRVGLFLVGLFIFMAVNIIIQSIVKPLITHTDEFYKIGNYSAVFMIVLTSYAILKYKLFNIKILATEIITVVLWIILFSQVILSQSLGEVIINGFIFLLVLIFGILLIRSVMNEVKQREKLQELTERLKALDKQKDEFISMAAHELRAPMTAIKGYVSMVMEGDTGDIPEKARGFLTDANNINDRLIRLINNMLNVSRIEEGRIVYQIEEENLSRFVRTVFSQFTPEVERRGLDYKLEIPTHLKDKVKVDPDRIQEVISNLLSNAVKYTDSGSITVKLSQSGSKFVRCEVIDTGPGISKEEQTKLFQKFHRVETNVGKTTGSGLGLYICKLLVENFGGKIGLSSVPGKGSIFWFELPLV